MMIHHPFVFLLETENQNVRRIEKQEVFILDVGGGENCKLYCHVFSSNGGRKNCFTDPCENNPNDFVSENMSIVNSSISNWSELSNAKEMNLVVSIFRLTLTIH